MIITSKNVREAANILREQGEIFAGDFYNHDNTKVCAMGAIAKSKNVIGDDQTSEFLHQSISPQTKFARAIDSLYPKFKLMDLPRAERDSWFFVDDVIDAIATFNDREATDVEEVALMLEAIADRMDKI